MHGVPKDAAQSVAWHRKAADLGYDLSQHALGTAYEFGLGVPKDINQALSWFRKAADKGDAIAQSALGRIYDEGENVEVNEKAALCWYQKVAQKDGFLKAEAAKAVTRLEKQVTSGGNKADCEED